MRRILKKGVRIASVLQLMISQSFHFYVVNVVVFGVCYIRLRQLFAYLQLAVSLVFFVSSALRINI